MTSRATLSAACILLAAATTGCNSCRDCACPTGDQPSKFELYIVGQRHNIIEVYFHNQGVDLDQFRRILPPMANAPALTCGDSVIVAPQSPSGTFAVIYGEHHEQALAFGWRPGTTKFESIDLLKEIEPPAEDAYPIRLKWITPQILKADCGRDASHELVFQFNPKDDKPWKLLFRGDAPPGQ